MRNKSTFLLAAVLALLFCLPARSQNPPAYISAGTLRCGAVRRGADQVQVWCYTGLAYTQATAYWNQLIWLEVGGDATSTLNVGADTIVWKFVLSASTLSYEVAANASNPRTGEL